MAETADEITRILGDVERGDRTAVDRLLSLLYGELRRIAARQLRRERGGHTLQPTALVHEAYLDMLGQQGLHWRDRAHFLGIAAHLMRQILVRHALRRRTDKRGGGLVRVTLDDSLQSAAGNVDFAVDLVALNTALDALARSHDRLARVVELRYFAGLSIPETAEVLGIGTATVEREWRAARAWLHRELTGDRER